MINLDPYNSKESPVQCTNCRFPNRERETDLEMDERGSLPGQENEFFCWSSRLDIKSVNPSMYGVPGLSTPR